ncbi:MAG: methyltransferase domain-containing protein [Anaerolineae bacterium]|nr:methyltransferase domain-containing protein [Anaerolineae bacterium]
MSKTTRVNYDAIAPTYDQRTQGGYLEGVTLALQNLARQVKAQRVLDLGCGTGRSLRGLADNFQPSPTCYGLDFSGGMLQQAQRFDARYRLVNASAPCPPFVPASFDLIFCVHAFHHFPDKPQVVQAAYRILRPGGIFAIVNFDPYESRHNWYVYDYFEGVYETDLRRFPRLAELEAMLIQTGFQHVSQTMVEHISDTIMGEAIFDNYFLRKDSNSQLILLSDEAYQTGLARMRARLAEAKANGENIAFQTEIKNWMCYGLKPI